LFSFITWHLLLKGRTKGEIQGSRGERSKKGTLRTDLLAIKDPEKRALCMAFWEYFSVQSLGEYVKCTCLGGNGGPSYIAIPVLALCMLH